MSKALRRIIPSVKPLKQDVPKGTPLVWDEGLKRSLYKTIVGCFSCRKPIYIVYTPIELGPMSSFTKPPEPCGDWEVPKTAGDPCPRCGKTFARFNGNLNRAEYWTDKGII